MNVPYKRRNWRKSLASDLSPTLSVIQRQGREGGRDGGGGKSRQCNYEDELAVVRGAKGRQSG